MKLCPKCSKTYGDDAAFCLQDATPLVFAAPNMPQPSQNLNAPNIFNMPPQNSGIVDNAPPFQQNQAVPNIFAPPPNNAGFQNSPQQSYQPVYQQTPRAASGNSGLRIFKKLLLISGIGVVFAMLGLFFKQGFDKVSMLELAPFAVIGALVIGGLVVIERLEKK